MSDEPNARPVWTPNLLGRVYLAKVKAETDRDRARDALTAAEVRLRQARARFDALLDEVAADRVEVSVLPFRRPA